MEHLWEKIRHAESRYAPSLFYFMVTALLTGLQIHACFMMTFLSTQHLVMWYSRKRREMRIADYLGPKNKNLIMQSHELLTAGGPVAQPSM